MRKSIGKKTLGLLAILFVVCLLIGFCGIFSLDGGEEQLQRIVEVYQSDENLHSPEMDQMLLVEGVEEIGIMYSNRMVLSVLFAIYLVDSVIITLVISRTIAKPAKKAGETIRGMVDKLDRGESDLTERIAVTTKDEVGQLAEGINKFIGSLQRTIGMIQNHSHLLDQTASNMSESVRNSNENAGTVSAVMQELSARMQEITATLEEVTTGAQSVLDASDLIKREADKGNRYMDEVKGRANSVNDFVKESKTSTNQMISEFSGQLGTAIENSKSVNQINSLTDDILNISNQTNLLALNASIEAARAGDAGRGFSVVADQIRVLAEESKQTANDIQVISKTVTEAVEELAKNAGSMVEYINANILSDYDNFETIAGQYHKDADNMSYMLERFKGDAEGLKRTMDEMVTGISGISHSIEESTQGAASAVDSTNRLVDAMAAIREDAESNELIAQELRSEVEKFKKI